MSPRGKVVKLPRAAKTNVPGGVGRRVEQVQRKDPSLGAKVPVAAAEESRNITASI